jgi:pyruvate ferredoxin oxidoreductase alpha subunit
MAPRIAEHMDIRLPVMVCLDGFIISHAVQTMKLEDDEAVRRFIGKFIPVYPLLDCAHPVTIGALDLQDYYIEHKRAQHQAIMSAKRVVQEISDEFAKSFGRNYGLFEAYKLEDAQRVIVAINSVAGEVKEVVDALREKGEKVGLLKIRLFRPFPYEQIREALSGAKIVTVLDRSCSFGAYGPLFTEIRTALYDLPQKPMVYNRVYGLGGRDMLMDDIEAIFAESKQYQQNETVDKVFDFIGVRGG